jgi:hypothetical protein
MPCKVIKASGINNIEREISEFMKNHIVLFMSHAVTKSATPRSAGLYDESEDYNVLVLYTDKP